MVGRGAKMDTSEKYAKMCKTWHVQRTKKGEPEAGDYYWLQSRGIVVLGFDHMNVSDYIKNRPYVRFAILQDLGKPIEFIDDVLPGTMCAKSGTYYCYKYRNPIYCPKVGQWLAVIAVVTECTMPQVFMDVGMGISKECRYYRQFDTMEQKLCAYYMEEEHSLYWWHSDNEWIKYDEALKRYKEDWG